MNNQLEELIMVELNPVNELMTTSEITESAPLTWPSKNLREEKNSMTELDTAHRHFSNTPEDKFQYQWMVIQ